VAFGPSFKLGDALKAGPFVQARCLEVIAGYPDMANISAAGLGNGGIQQGAPIALSAIGLVNPQLFEFGLPAQV
jgi:hypothetical protein